MTTCETCKREVEEAKSVRNETRTAKLCLTCADTTYWNSFDWNRHDYEGQIDPDNYTAADRKRDDDEWQAWLDRDRGYLAERQQMRRDF
jgi:hypothetical protein